MDTKIYIGIVIFLIFIGIILLIDFQSKNKYSCSSNNKESNKKEIKENFPSSELNLLYTDQNGNMGITKEPDVKYLNISNDANVNIVDAGKIKQKGEVLIPRGLVTIWSGTTTNIPSGWVLCDGKTVTTTDDNTSYKTPDLRNKFIAGAGYSYKVGTEGGEDSVSLTIDQIPSHNHEATDSGHSHRYSDRLWVGGTGNYHGSDGAGTSSIQRTTQIGMANITISNTGTTTSHENRPPFYALCYIIKI
jgi:microcystin-dependent protein